MEEIAEGFNRLQVLVSELLTVEKSQSKIEENGMFVKDLLQQLSESVFDENVTVEGATSIISDCDEDLDTSTEFSAVDGEDGGPKIVNEEEVASPKISELDGSCAISDSSSSSGSCSTTPSRGSAAAEAPTATSAAVQAGSGKSKYEMIREDIIAERNEQLRAMGFFDEFSVLRSEMAPIKPLRNKVKSPVKEKKRRGWVRRSERLFLSSSDGDQSVPNCNKPYVKTIVEEILNSVSQEKKLPVSDTSEFICENCGKEFRKKRYLTQHVKKVHTKSKSILSLPKQDDSHDESSGKRAVFSCGKCKFTSINKRSMSSHKARAHTFEVRSEGDVFTCDKCNFVHKNKSRVDKHIFLVHKLEERSVKGNVYACEECDFTNKNKLNLFQHIIRAHKEVSGEKNVFDCEQCNYTTTKKRNLSRHSRVHEGKMKSSGKLNSCDLCSYVTRHSGNLSRHKSSLHPVDSTTPNVMSVESDTESIEIFTDDSDDEDTPVTSSI